MGAYSLDSFLAQSPPASANSLAASTSTHASTIRATPPAGYIPQVTSNIRVVVRIRPKTNYEISRENSPHESYRSSHSKSSSRTIHAVESHEGEKVAITPAGDNRTLLLLDQNCPVEDKSPRSLSFHRVYEEFADQESLFDDCGVKDLVLQALNGYAATVFAFGQTGSGKTFTITGPEVGWNMYPERLGIIPRAIEFLFQQITMRSSTSTNNNAHNGAGPPKFKVRATYLEIYNEMVQDLLSPLASSTASLPVRWTAEKGFYVEHAITVDCEDLDDCIAVLEEGLKNRRTGAHRLNECSSRSHSIMTLYVENSSVDGEDGGPVVTNGKISFVDLAGSERVRESQAQGETLTETMSINKSLLTLGNCISALADPKKRNGHIPYRDSNLTRLLSDSLGGHGLALMIACISPSTVNLQESLKTLRYAARARKIRNRPSIQIGQVKDRMLALRREVNGLRRENAALRAAVEGRSTTTNSLIDGRSMHSGASSLMGTSLSTMSLSSSCKLPDISVPSNGSLCASRNSNRGAFPPAQIPTNVSPYLSRFLRSTSRNSLDEMNSHLPPIAPTTTNKSLHSANGTRQLEMTKRDSLHSKTKTDSSDRPLGLRPVQPKEAVPSKKTLRSRLSREKSTNSLPEFTDSSSTTLNFSTSKRDSSTTLVHANDTELCDVTADSMGGYPLASLQDVVALKQLIVNDVDALDREIGLMSSYGEVETCKLTE
ncbi:Kinesin- protein 12 [Chytriomyces hyalinus]|nr:Kinesin- protein 12 [Chytriomyces hyalinus]